MNIRIFGHLSNLPLVNLSLCCSCVRPIVVDRHHHKSVDSIRSVRMENVCIRKRHTYACLLRVKLIELCVAVCSSLSRLSSLVSRFSCNFDVFDSMPSSRCAVGPFDSLRPHHIHVKILYAYFLR